MKYFGKPIIKQEEQRNLEYIRCDNCSKKIKDEYFSVWLDNPNKEGLSILFFDICNDCFNGFIIEKVKALNIDKGINIFKSDKTNRTDHYADYLNNHALMENDKVMEE